MYYLSNKTKLKVMLKVLIVLILLLFAIHFGLRILKFESFRSQIIGNFQTEVTGQLLNYQYTYLRPPNSIQEFISFLEVDLEIYPSARIENLVQKLKKFEKELKIVIDSETGFLYMYYLGFSYNDEVDNVINSKNISIVKSIFCYSAILIAYYELPELCIDNQYRVYIDYDVFVNEYSNYDTLISNVFKPNVQRFAINNAIESTLDIVITLDFIHKEIKVHYCSDFSNEEIKSLFNGYMADMAFKIDWTYEPDSLIIPIRIKSLN